MQLIDTSSWIHALRRKGDPAVRERVQELLSRNEGAWCNIVRLELWRGAENDWDKELLGYLEENIKLFAINGDVWQRSVVFSQKLRVKGITVPLPDLVVFSCAAVHDVEIEHADKHFDLLTQHFPIGI